MTIKTEARAVYISLRQYNAERCAWSENMIDDLEDVFCATHDTAENGYIIATSAELANIADYWQTEADTANGGNDGEQLTAAQNGNVWAFTVRPCD